MKLIAAGAVLTIFSLMLGLGVLHAGAGHFIDPQRPLQVELSR